jgi:peroxiredoxin
MRRVTPTDLTDAPPASAADRKAADEELRHIEGQAVATRLVGRRIPEVELRSAAEGWLEMAFMTRNAAILYFYPGAPSQTLVTEDRAEARDFRDHFPNLIRRGYHVIGVHAQTAGHQLRYMMDGVRHFLAADPRLRLADLLDVPTYQADGDRVYHRLTLVVEESRVVHAFYPVSAPEHSATQVIDWLRRCRPSGALGLLRP